VDWDATQFLGNVATTQRRRVETKGGGALVVAKSCFQVVGIVTWWKEVPASCGDPKQVESTWSRQLLQDGKCS
jgi:hypothetical protein